VFTSERTAEIEATSIVSGEINAAGHLVLTRHDGTPIDMGAVSGVQLDGGASYAKADVFSYVGDTDPGAVPDGSVWFDTTGPTGPFASTTQQGLIEIATDAETVTGTDAQRAVTPAGVAAAINAKILAPNAITETAAATAYPLGMSQMSLTTASGWSLNSGFGSAVTFRTETDRTVQYFYSNPGGVGTPRSWMRQYHTSNNGGGWTAWAKVMTLKEEASTDATQADGIASYPPGWSRIYFDNLTSAGWEFAGQWGELLTYYDGAGLGRQTWQEHGSNGSAPPRFWMRTGNTGGWSQWAKYMSDPGAWTAYTSTWSTQTGANTPTYGDAINGTKYIKNGRKVTVLFDVAFGAGTNFGGGGGTDNWRFSLPVPAASGTGTLGMLELWDSSATAAGFARARLVNTTTFELVMSVGLPGTLGNIVDSSGTQPWAWGANDAVRGTLTYESAS